MWAERKRSGAGRKSVGRERSGERAKLSAQRLLRSRPQRDVKSVSVIIKFCFDLLTNSIHPHSSHSTDDSIISAKSCLLIYLI